MKDIILSKVHADLVTDVAMICDEIMACWPETLLKALGEFPEARLQQLGCLWSYSGFVAGYTKRHPEFLVELLHEMSSPSNLNEAHYRDRLTERISSCENEEQLASALRHFRHQSMCRILWRDFSRSTTVWDTTANMTWLADACIDLALDWLYVDSCRKWGTPMAKNAAGEWQPQRMVVLGMGKLGAHELNVSSDIDLMFAYPHNGETQGDGRTMENQTFFIRLGQRLIQALDKMTADGFVFRVDMRLRPYGDSGALALSFAAMEEYYQDQGRDWERYAMIKARVVAGDQVMGAALMEALRPFVYRRYIDFSAFESLREMKMMISREVRRKGLESNIKLGSGGIREIEFVTQAFQLIRGGRDKYLQCRELRTVLGAIKAHGLLPAEVVDDLLESYVFLRDLEHAIQGMEDKQTQLLPADDKSRLIVALIMGYENWVALDSVLQSYRKKVMRQFADVVTVADEEGAEGSTLDDHWHLIWEGKVDEGEAASFLQGAGFEDRTLTLKQLQDLRESKPVVVMQVQGRQRLDKFMPILLHEVTQAEAPSQTLSRILRLVEAVIRRTAYLVLLYENPSALRQLVSLCSASPWIAEQLAQAPVLLDELLNTESLYSPPNKETLADELRQQMLRIPEEDLEEQMEALRHFKKAHVLRVAASELRGTLPLMKVSDYLTFIAETVLQYVLKIAWQSMVLKYGVPQREAGVPCDLDFAIIGYGKLGGIELGYSSDLDLVFIHDVNPMLQTDGDRSIDNGVFFTRLGQRIIHILSTSTVSGQLYEVDMRLRPSGNSGLLVSSLNAFQLYQQKEAWTWEHQALVRARPVAGSAEVAAKFAEVRQEILMAERDLGKLRQEVVEMRQKMRDSLATPVIEGKPVEVFHTKHDPGGIVDIEFMVQFLTLAYARQFPDICRWPDNIRLLEECGKAGVISASVAQSLANAYISLRTMIHKQALQNLSSKVDSAMFVQERRTVTDVWKQIMQA